MKPAHDKPAQPVGFPVPEWKPPVRPPRAPAATREPLGLFLGEIQFVYFN